MNTTFAEIVKEAEQLSEGAQNKLIYHLRVKQAVQKTHGHQLPVQKSNQLAEPWVLAYGAEDSSFDREPTRQDLIDELNTLRVLGAFENVESLYGKFANPNLPEIGEEDFHAMLHTIAIAQSMGFSEPELMHKALTVFLHEQRRAVLQTRLEILSRYGVQNITALEEKITEALVPEHPAWEDLIIAENLGARLEELDAYLRNL